MKTEQLRFRGQNIKGQWHYGLVTHDTDKDSDYDWFISNKAGKPYAFGAIEKTIGQYIGLDDKNCRMLFDGDIVKDRFGRILRIGVWNYRFCFIAISETNFHHADFFDWIERDNRSDDETFPTVEMNVELIGNIHDNPELLTK